MNNIAIKVRNVQKSYKLYNKPTDRLKEALSFLRKKSYHKNYDALKNISFEINKGEVVGIIGKNGAGKSTLLKIITGVLTPTNGDIEVNGRISSLLELGAGFNPEYTGLENIYLQGTLLGIDKSEIDSRLNEIIEFADIGDFIHQPVKMYSSGMFARLAFATAINVDPDILIVDEALSVGDMAFQEKCITKMKSMVTNERAILFVSHSMPSIRNFCTKAIWIKDGYIQSSGEAHIVCEQYSEYMKEELKEEKISLQNISNNKEDKSIYIKNVSVSSNHLKTDEELSIYIDIGFNKKISDYAIGVLIYDDKGKLVTLFNTIRDDIIMNQEFTNFELVIPSNDFLSGEYFISVAISDTNVMFSYDREDYVSTFRIENKLSGRNLPIAEGMFRAKHCWKF